MFSKILKKKQNNVKKVQSFSNFDLKLLKSTKNIICQLIFILFIYKHILMNKNISINFPLNFY